MVAKYSAIVFAALFTLTAQACPLGMGETELTLSQVMRNFGRLTLKADQVIRNGTAFPEDISEEELTEARMGIEKSRSCAEAVLNDETGALAPRKAAELQGAKLEAYMQKYTLKMTEFADLLKEYEEMFAALAGKKRKAADFEALQAKRKAVLDKANESHAALQ